MKKTATEWAQRLVDDVSMVTQILPSHLANAEDWQRCAKHIIQQAIVDTVRSTVSTMNKSLDRLDDEQIARDGEKEEQVVKKPAEPQLVVMTIYELVEQRLNEFRQAYQTVIDGFARAARARPAWENDFEDIDDVDVSTSQLDTRLMARGRDGWELVQVMRLERPRSVMYRCFFKRLKRS